jgi:hypothetical protein
MTNRNPQEQPSTEGVQPPEVSGLSLMAIQELLGLFRAPQTHANHTMATAGKSTTDLQAALEDKPLTYL